MGERWRWIGWGALVFVALAAAGIGLSAYLFSRWSEIGRASPQDAALAFSTAAAEAGGGPPYVEIALDGSVQVHTELHRAEPTDLATLHLLAWEPQDENLLRIGFPFWFVRVKMNDTFNLGSLTAALTRDWNNLDLKVSVEELERRGPGLVLDHRLADGSRLLLWTEAAVEPLLVP